MKPALRETWRPFVGKTKGGADGDNGGKLLLWLLTTKSSHDEQTKADLGRTGLKFVGAHFKSE